MKERILRILTSVIHPESGLNLVDSGMVENITATENKISVTICFQKTRDPFQGSIKKQIVSLLKENFPEAGENINVFLKESSQKKVVKEPAKADGTGKINHTISIASGKGGVGKSTVTANLAVSLTKLGYKVGILDADIYGPSQTKMFGVEDYIPVAENIEGVDMIIPAENYGVKIMSIGFFIKSDDALVWRGPMATSALKQLIHQTNWGMLDFLLIDLPPGTGDVHLTMIQELNIDGAVIVSTPQQISIADVKRGIAMFNSENVNIPVLGMIENMSWFTPAELPQNKYYIFGHGGAQRLAEDSNIEFLGHIPIIQSIMQQSDDGKPASLINEDIAEYYLEATKKIVNNLN